MKLKERAWSKRFLFKLTRRLSIYSKSLLPLMPERFICRGAEKFVLLRSALDERLKQMLGEVDADFFEDVSESSKTEIIWLANQTLENSFNILGSGWVKLSQMRWNVDLRTNSNWPNHQYYLRQRVSTPKGADIKSPWELSRGHFLLWLGEAFLITKEERYAKKVVELINDWIDQNPLMYTVNWTCSMDVAIRAVNWMYAINMLSGSAALTDSFAEKISRSFYQHGFFIWNNLEKSEPWSNNHYTSDLVGLLYLGTLFCNTKKGNIWRKFAIKEFYGETRKQVLPSGVHYEKSISYHRLMVELTSYPIAMLKRSGEPIPEDIIGITQKMYDYVGTYIKPNGLAPLLADNDDGRFLPFTSGDFRDHRYLLDVKGIDQKIVNSGISPLFHLDYYNGNRKYSDAGVVIIKEHGVYLLINNSGYSKKTDFTTKRIGTHTHNDQLSFEFSIGSEDIIIDPGTYVYTSSIVDRNKFRSTRKHNTIIVDDEEHNILSESNAFSMTMNNTKRRIVAENGICEGSYETIQEKMKHERSFKLTEGEMTITDKLFKEGKGHNGCMYFHLSDLVGPHKVRDSVRVDSRTHDINIRCEAYNTNRNVDINIFEDDYSPSYGVLKPTKGLEMSFSFDNQCTIITVIEWKKK